MSGHLLFIFMTAGAQLHNFILGSAPSQAMGKMRVYFLRPGLIRMAALASGKRFPGKCLAFTPKARVWIIGSVRMAVGARGAIFGELFLTVYPLTVDTVFILFHHATVRKFSVRGRVFQMAFYGAVDLFHVFVGYFVQIHVAAFTPQLPMNGFCKQLIINIINPFVAGFIISSHSGVSMANQAIFFIR
jgi:hypothetical protein